MSKLKKSTNTARALENATIPLALISVFIPAFYSASLQPTVEFLAGLPCVPFDEACVKAYINRYTLSFDRILCWVVQSICFLRLACLHFNSKRAHMGISFARECLAAALSVLAVFIESMYDNLFIFGLILTLCYVLYWYFHLSEGQDNNWQHEIAESIDSTDSKDQINILNEDMLLALYELILPIPLALISIYAYSLSQDQFCICSVLLYSAVDIVLSVAAAWVVNAIFSYIKKVSCKAQPQHQNEAS